MPRVRQVEITPLRFHRFRSGHRQWELASACERPQPWLYAAEMGKVTVPIREARILSKILKVPIEELFPDGYGLSEDDKSRQLPPRTIPRTMDIFLPASHKDGTR